MQYKTIIYIYNMKLLIKTKKNQKNCKKKDSDM